MRNRAKDLEYRRSKGGILRRVYAAQKKTSRERGHESPAYSFQEFEQWVLGQSRFHEMHEAYRQSGYKRNFIPTIDRIDDSKGYYFGNIQLLTLIENVNKSVETRTYRTICGPVIDGKLKCKKCGTVKTVDNFYRNRSRMNGYGGICKACDNALRKEWYWRKKGQTI